MSILPLPLRYRADLLDKIYKHLQAGKCGALYGIASSGKSRLVEFMGRPDVRERYLGQNWTKTLFPWVDGNDLLEHTEWGLYEKILNAIVADLAQLPDRGGADRLKAEEWYWQLIQTENRSLARRYAAFAIEDLAEYRVVLLLDDVEEFLAQNDDLVFNGLRGLRDRFKRDNQYRMMYLWMSRHKPVNVRADSPAFEGFLELFKNFTHPIGCYDHDDALFMIQRLAEAYPLKRSLTNDLVEQLIEVTGGHAGLIDAAFHSDTETNWARTGLAHALINADSVWNECVSIYESLSEDNWKALEDLNAGRDPGIAATRVLEEAGLVRRDARQASQVVELLKLFARRYAVEQGQAVTLDPDQRTVTIGGVAVPLDIHEFAVVQRLYQSGGQTCSYRDLYLCMYPNDTYRDNLQTVVKRLVDLANNKLQRVCGKRVIMQVLGQGYRLISAGSHQA